GQVREILINDVRVDGRGAATAASTTSTAATGSACGGCGGGGGRCACTASAIVGAGPHHVSAAEGADVRELIEMIQAGECGFRAAHRKAGDRAMVAVLRDVVFLFDARHDFGEKGIGEVDDHIGGSGAAALMAVAERIHHNHRLRFAL